MNFKTYLSILLENKKVIIITTIVTVVVATVITFMITPIYSATAILRVATASAGSASYSDYMYADRLMNTYTKIATSRPLLDELASKLNLSKAPSVKVSIIPSSELLQITVESPNPEIAKNAANTLGDILIAQSNTLYAGGGKSTLEILSEQLAQALEELNQARQEFTTFATTDPEDTEEIASLDQKVKAYEKTYANLLVQYEQARLQAEIRANNITFVEPAVLPQSPSKPRKSINIFLALIVGAAGGVGLAFLFENMDPRLYASDQIKSTVGLNSIGKVPFVNTNRLFSKISEISLMGDPIFNEYIRSIRVNILAQIKAGPDSPPIKNLLITSAESGEGKSIITANLALSLAQSGLKVIIVDCDMRKPHQHRIYKLSNSRGLSNVLTKTADLESVIQNSGYLNLQVLTSGPPSLDPTELLGSPQVKSLIEQLKPHYDIMLFDAPAMLAVADASALAPWVDGILLIARRNYVRAEAMQEVRLKLAEIKTQWIGLVINEAERNGTYSYYYSQHRGN